MIAQLRIYPITEGRLDEWIEFFNEKLAPIHAAVGIRLLGAWANRETNEFTWIREFADEADAIEKEAAYRAHPARQALGTIPQDFHGPIDVRLMTDVFHTATSIS